MKRSWRGDGEMDEVRVELSKRRNRNEKRGSPLIVVWQLEGVVSTSASRLLFPCHLLLLRCSLTTRTWRTTATGVVEVCVCWTGMAG